ncbi:related to dehydrogenases with different specificities (related to short-chain alcohol dehydrogenases) [Phialocephala subalpina]|uniref:Related to dehydrogenases with different specificities (Related to short-chain alcohol dehydrogenases) n=1 Tax=Phialocephala subalpina TaxID=576137 RepID=A0A1L7WEZ5_9HELO|nr:related to dehydrogenases with different specificities (related to short-chain alcohol dehydrogenases) [Phialocephala subalpina]
MPRRLLGRIAIVTGASSGIGRAIALTYAQEGASVMCADISLNASEDEHGKSTHEVIIAGNGKAAFVKTDVTDESQVKALIAESVKVFGRLDIMVNNAGVCSEIFGIASQVGGLRVHETTMETFDKTMNVNARGVFLGCKYALAQFLAQEPLPRNSRGDATRGWIVNVASLAGIVGFQGAPSYTMSKHAVVGLTKEIGISYAKDRVHCNALCPAFIDTPLIAPITKDRENPIAVGTTQAVTAAHPWGTLGQTEDVARAAVFLVSEDSQWITAQPLVIDGGYMAQ